MTPAALAVAAFGANLGTVLTVGTTVLVALLAAGSALGGFAAFKTGRTNAIAASAVARAGEAEATAASWKSQLEAARSEFTIYREEAERQQQRDREALAVAEHDIAKLKERAATLEGVVTARHELAELVQVVTGIAQSTGALLARVQQDHERQHQDHTNILAAVGGRRAGDND